MDKHISSASHDFPTFGALLRYTDPAQADCQCRIQSVCTQWSWSPRRTLSWTFSIYQASYSIFKLLLSFTLSAHGEKYIQNKKLAKTFKSLQAFIILHFHGIAFWYICQEVCSIFIVLHRRFDFDTGVRCAFSTSLFAMEGVAVIFMYVIVTLFNGLVHKIIQRYYWQIKKNNHKRDYVFPIGHTKAPEDATSRVFLLLVGFMPV